MTALIKRGSRDSNPDSRFWRPRASPLTHSPKRVRDGSLLSATPEKILRMQPFAPRDGWSYSLLLGCYLGDGCVSQTARTYQLRVVLDGLYPNVTDDCVMRGLIHSDGCRTVNRFKTKLPSGRVAEYAYPRYFLSNQSADIRGLFCEYCERLGIRWTQSNPRNISVSHRDSVARLDEFVGPKR